MNKRIAVVTLTLSLATLIGLSGCAPAVKQAHSATAKPVVEVAQAHVSAYDESLPIQLREPWSAP